ncbi:hypothetical protein NQ317_011151 [Molorchus minor]|uniref:Integrase SAM-like N-terminal domain-containing protein n=1 Tax=Molorchus minor TaxID=1323400 RepID=A0ABQ9JGA7_9CUCU|nr:hypothetical protein NQ317_011151 [Molorchus minor]
MVPPSQDHTLLRALFPWWCRLYPGSFHPTRYSQETLNTIVSSLSPTTIKQYTTTYKLWWSFCSMRGIEPVQWDYPRSPTILQTQLEKGNNKYGYLNSHRSALSLILPGSIGEDVLMKRFMRGLSKIRPSSPKYQVMGSHYQFLDTWSRLPPLA